MSVKDFQNFISADEQLLALGRVVNKVNLVQLSVPQTGLEAIRRPPVRGRGAPAMNMPMPTQSRVALVLDAEHCLDRLYGGCFPDWTCGGEWRNMVAFLGTLFSTMQHSNVHVAVFFNGAIEPARFKEWKEEQRQVKTKVKQVLNHLLRRGTPPPKAFWIPPCTLRTLLKIALRSMNVTVLNSVDDHRLEMMGFCWENGFHGVLSDDGEMALFCPPRYFSAHSMKLSLNHDLTTTEFVVDEVAKCLDLNPNRFCLLGTLLGNHILLPADLAHFYEQLVPETADPANKVPFDRVIRAVVTYVRALPSITDFDKIAADIFGSSKDPRIKKLRDSVKYYQSGARDGYAKLKPTLIAVGRKVGDSLKCASEENMEAEVTSTLTTEAIQQNGKKEKISSKKKTAKKEGNSTEATLVERIALDLDQLDLAEMVNNSSSDEEKSSDSKTKSSTTSSVVKAVASGVNVAPSEAGKYPTKTSSVRAINIPEAPSEVRRVALERHRQGQMSPFVCQILRRGEIKLPVLLEDENSPELPLIHRLYQPLRQTVYAILFNVHHVNFNRKQMDEKIRGVKKSLADLKKQEKKPDLSEEEKAQLAKKINDTTKELSELKPLPKAEFCVREWLPYNDYSMPDVVDAAEIHWGVPTVQRLWFSTAAEDKEKRLRAFLTCMRCDDVQGLMVPANVPQHVIILACVLRYIMKSTKIPVLQKPELDAFLVTAFSPEIGNHKYLAEMTLDYVTTRGVQLATLFMQGIEMAIMANDACGAPVPSEICLPTFFDGKLFHFKLRRAAAARNLMELCDGRVEMAEQVERMRSVILHGVVPASIIQPPHFTGHMPNHFQPMHPQSAPPGRGGMMGGPGRPGPGPNLGGHGGRLIVGGSVVSQWDNHRGGAAQQRLLRTRVKDKKGNPATKQQQHQIRRPGQKASDESKLCDDGDSSGHLNGNGVGN